VVASWVEMVISGVVAVVAEEGVMGVMVEVKRVTELE